MAIKLGEEKDQFLAEVHFAGRQDIGKRSNQEDAYGVVPPFDLGGGRTLLALVADGMGGHAAGEVASGLVVQFFVDGFFNVSAVDDGSRMWSGLETANRQIGRAAEERPELRGMGSTLIAVLLRDDMVRWISVGDSPLYLVRGGAVRRLNQLHLVGGDPEDGAVDPPAKSGVLASAIIGERLFEVDDSPPERLSPGDLLVAASDGLNTLSTRDLLEILDGSPDRSAADHAQALIQAVSSRSLSTQDNTTVVVVRWG